MLDALALVIPTVGAKKLSAYFVIRAGTVSAFNGSEVATSPIACDLEFAPKAKAFFRAVKKCAKTREPIALWVNPEGNVMVHAGEVTETVECQPLEQFPAQLDGLWFDAPRPRKPPKPKAVPPEPVWLKPDYLPGLEEARAFRVPLMTVAELLAAQRAQEPLIWDIEIFENYFIAAFVSVVTGKVFYFERVFNPDFNADEIGNSLNSDTNFEALAWVAKNFLLVDFNGNFFDVPILALALAGKTCREMKRAANLIISEQVKPWQVLRSFKTKKLELNHIDLIEVCPLDASLKLYAGRLHAPRMQDLPFPHDAVLSPDQITILRYYNVNDLTNTAFCFVNLREQIELRQSMSQRYRMDLRSKSDAQIAEAVISGEMERLTFSKPQRPEIPPGTRFRYPKPAFVKFETPMMNRVLNLILGWEFHVSETGYVEIPNNPETGKPWNLQVRIAGALYTIGMGGLHSNETTVCHKADAATCLVDRDVTSYYPNIMLNLGLFPKHLGPAFLTVFRSIVDRRQDAKKAAKAAKEAGNKVLEMTKKAEAETLKIVVNGTFGKTSNKWSALYGPELTMTITITGQLSLLMLIERLELRGFTVCSANTDGIVVKCPRVRRDEMNAVFASWERDTGFATEETEYAAIYSRDVNNYLAVKTDGKTKTKGAYFNPWASPEYKYERFKKNPTCTILIDAVTEYLTNGKPVAETIRAETDIRKFVAIRTVRGGAVKDGVYLGKAVRWYYGEGETGCIVYALSGKKVAETDGARPCMVLPEKLPADLDFAHYEREAEKILVEIGALPGASSI